ncbi:flagellin [Hyphomonas sp.]|uniref:flagellin n=1 Tax=Hyphomonas sp. TaxID=87 RepID=UPI0025B97D5A|nr:flagellin [Hyphomonas sp.]
MRIPPPNSLISAQFTQNIADLRQSIARTAEEATTGRYSDLTAHLSGRIGSAMLSQKAVDAISFEREQLSQREVRLDITQSNLALLHERSVGVGVSMRIALGSGDLVAQGLAARDAKAALGNIFGALNVRYGERYLFAGDATATLPLPNPSDLLSQLRTIADGAATPADFASAIDTYFNDPAGGWQQSIYRGADTASDPDAITASNPAIIEIISGLAVLALADPINSPPVLLSLNPDVVDAAADRVSSGTVTLTNVRSELGVKQEQIRADQKLLDIEETIVTTAFNSLTARDQFEAASALKILESNLEASYLLTSRLASLSLLNFMR